MPDFDVNTPHIARIYDYWLGGANNVEADRKAVELALGTTPTIVPGVRANRRFLGRAVRFMAAGQVRVQDWRATSELDFNSAPTAMWAASGGRSSDG